MQKFKPQGCLLALLFQAWFVLIPALSYAATTSGTLIGDEVWSGIVMITGDVTVPEGVTLTIEPGTKVVFPAQSDDRAGGIDSGRSELIVYGTLAASGAEDNGILLTSESPVTPQKRDWGGIRMIGDSVETSLSLTYVTVEYAMDGLSVSLKGSQAALSVVHCTIQHSSGNGILVMGEGSSTTSLNFNNNSIRDQGGYGIVLEADGPGTQFVGSVSGNVIESSGGYGLYIGFGRESRIDLSVSGNSLRDNGSYGIFLSSSNNLGVESRVGIEDNVLSGNSTGIASVLSNGEITLEIVGNSIYRGGLGIISVASRNSTRSALLISRNRVYDNEYCGIICYIYDSEAYPEITANEVFGNAADGIRLEGDCSYGSAGCVLRPLIGLNSIYENSGLGIFSQANDPFDLLLNNLHSNVGHDLFNDSSSPVDARFNYWGPSVTAEMNAAGGWQNISVIYDRFDDTSKGLVNYLNWMESPVDGSLDIRSKIIQPLAGDSLGEGQLAVQVFAYAEAGVDRVQVSLDGGLSWTDAASDLRYPGRSVWNYTVAEIYRGTYTVLSRVIARNGQVESPGDRIAINIKGDQTTSGTLTHNELWSGTVFLEGDVVVPEGLSLTLLPGTTIRVPALRDPTGAGEDPSRSEITVMGSLIARGTESQPIVFTSDAAQPAKGDWAGISAGGTLDLKFVTVEYATIGVQFAAVSGDHDVLIGNSTIRFNSGDGVSISVRESANGSVVIENNSVTGNGGIGISISAHSRFSTSILSRICGNTVANNGTMGIHCLTDAGGSLPNFTATICRNTISGHSNQGINCRTLYTRSQLTIDHNTIDHSGTGIAVEYQTTRDQSGSTLSIEGNILAAQSRGIDILAVDSGIAPNILDNTIHHHTAGGILCMSDHFKIYPVTPYLSGNQIFDNAANGIILNVSTPVTVFNNSLYGNSSFDIANYSGFPVDARGNWWGVDTSNEMNSGGNPKNIGKIFDAFDDSACGAVDYAEWLNLFDVPRSPGLNPVMSYTADTSQILSGTKDSGTSIVLNGTEVVAVDSEGTWSCEIALKEGNNPLNLYSRTPAGMVSQAVNSWIVRDTTAPRILRALPANGSYLRRMVEAMDLTITEESTEIDVEATLDGASVRDSRGEEISGHWAVDANRFVFTPEVPIQEDGAYVLTLHPTDKPIGNMRTETVVFTIDTKVPTGFVLNEIQSPTNVSPYTLSGTKEPASGVWLDDSEIVSSDGSTQWAHSLSLNEGENRHRLYAMDLAGNRSEETIFGIVFDSVPPILDGTEPLSGSFVRESPSRIDFLFRDPTSGLDLPKTLASAKILSAKWDTIPGSWDILQSKSFTFTPSLPLAEGVYRASIRAVDLAGNVNPATLDFTFDITAPWTPALDPVTSPTNYAVQTLSGTKDADSSIWINGYQAVSIDMETAWSYRLALSEGVNDLEITARDGAGNQSSKVFARIEYDNTAPLPVTTLRASGSGPGNTVFLDWYGYEEDLQGDIAAYLVYVSEHFFAQVDGMTPVGRIGAGNFAHQVYGLLNGSLYHFAVVAVDTRGNARTSVDPVSATPSDSQAPEDPATIQVQCSSSRLLISWQHSPNTRGDLAGYHVYFGNPAQVHSLGADEDSLVITDVKPATAIPVTVRAFDSSGNESGGTGAVAVSLLDNPVQVSASPYSNMVTLSWAPSLPPDYVMHYSVYVSNNDFTRVEDMVPRLYTWETSVTVAGLSNDVPHFLAVTAVNASGCETKEVRTISATPRPDRQGPVVSNVRIGDLPMTNGMAVQTSGMLTLDASDPAGVSRVEFHLDGNPYAVDTSAVGPYRSYLDILPLGDGNHNLTVIAYDTLANPTSLSYTLAVALRAPLAPSISSPANGLLINTPAITVSGGAEANMEVLLYVNGLQKGSPGAVDGSGRFSLGLSLSEGENRVQAAVRNRAGISPKTPEILVTVDTTLPQKPTGLSAQPASGGIIGLNWRASAEGLLKGYHVYRASGPFISPSEATKINGAPVIGTAFQDLPHADGTYYYRVSSVDRANNESPLSDAASAVSDRLPPVATSIQYISSGLVDMQTGRMAPGMVRVHLAVSEPLLLAPFLSITPEGGAPIAVELNQTAPQEYSGLFVIGDTTPSGTAYAVFSARDRIGNRGTEIALGESLLIDTTGPAVTQIFIQPAHPVRNDEQEPVTVSFMIGLNEAVKPGSVPELAFLLSGQGRNPVAIPNLSRTSAQPGHVQTWIGSFVLPADAGRSGVENLELVYSGVDDLGNTSNRILCLNHFQVYQGDLPPVETPQGFAGKALPGGRVMLSWKEVSGAAGYQLYRKTPGESEISIYERLGNVLEFIDQTSQEGSHLYAVASIRQENGQEAVSARSAAVQVVSDATAPLAPQGLTLQLVGQGILASWLNPSEDEPASYSLYRADAGEILSVTGMTPIVKGVRGVQALDNKPSTADHCYVVTALDEAGNESPPSNSAYLNFTLLPVSSLKVVQDESNPPVISWTHPGGDIAGYDLRVGPVKLNRGLLTSHSLTDAGWTGDERSYSVTAVDGNGVESPARSTVLPSLHLTLKEGEQLKRGLMNRLEYLVSNRSAAKVEHARLRVLLNSRQHLSEEFALDGATSRVVPVSVGGYADLADLTGISTAVVITPHEGEEVQVIRSGEIEVQDGMLLLEILNEPFTRGGTGRVQFTLKNTGEEEIEIVTATGSGSSPSPDVGFSLLDEDGNVLSHKLFQQSLGQQLVTLANGKTVARIGGGAVFTSDVLGIPVPLNAPDQVAVQQSVANIYYHLAKPEQVVMDGVGTRRRLSLVDTVYFGEVTSITPEVSNGGEDIVISGRSVERATDEPVAAVPLKLVISVNSFERTYNVFTDASGQFSYRFAPLALESGVFKVWAVHPDIQDKPVQKRFIINRLTIQPQTISLNLPRNYEQLVWVHVSAGEGTEVHNLRLAHEAAGQPGGALQQGIHVNPGTPLATLGSKASISFPVGIWADNTANQTDRLILRVKSDEKEPGDWGSVVINGRFSDPQPALYSTPDHLETGVAFDGTASETVTLENRGLADLNEVTLALVDQNGSPAPVWVYLNANPLQGVVGTGERRPVNLFFAPTSASAWEGFHTLYLRVASSNFRTVDVPVYVSVTEAGIGSVIFKVSDIYTGTVDRNGDIVQGLAGAAVSIQNENVLNISRTLRTDGFGEAFLDGLPAGRYQYRITASNHQEQTGRLWIKPGMTVSEESFLAYNLVTVEWSVVETTLADKYEIVLKATYETNVPAAVLVIEPASISLPAMRTGDVLNGEFTLTNYGLIRADHLQFVLPAADAHFSYELPSAVPESVDAKARLSVPYRIVCLRAPNPAMDGGASGGGCQRNVRFGSVAYDYECANGNHSYANFPYGYLYDNGECSGSSGNSGGGTSGGGGTDVYGPPADGGGGGGGGPTPAPAPIKGAKCWPTPIRKEKTGGCPLDTRQEISQDVGSSVDLVLREFNDSATDLRVKVAGGEIAVSRIFYGDEWHFEALGLNLRFIRDSLGQTIESIEKGGVLYAQAGVSSGVYLNETSRITREAERYVWRDKFGNWKAFALNGRMMAYGSRTGLLGRLLYAGDEQSSLTGIADRNGQQVVWFDRNVEGQITGAFDAEGRRVEYGYIGSKLVRVSDVLGNVTSYQYDDTGRLIGKTDGAGRRTTIGYDGYGNVSHVADTGGQGFFFEFDYDAGKKEHYARVKTSMGKVKEVWSDRDGDVKRVDINGRSIRKILKDGRNLMVTDENGAVTRKELDEWQNVTRIIYPDGSSVSYEYEHSFNQRVREIDARGTVIIYRYDEFGNLVEKTEASGTLVERKVRYTHDGEGNILSIRRLADAITPESLTVMTYDTSGNRVSSTDPEGGVTEFAHDLKGNLLAVTDPRGKFWSFEYDAAGKLIKSVDPLGSVTRSIYDASGNKVKEIDAEGRETSHLYDEHNRLTSTIDAAGNVTRFEYNSDGKLTRRVDPEEKTVQSIYDSEERLIKIIDGNGNEIRYEYTDYSGCSSCSGGLDQPSKTIYPTFTREHQYDLRGRRIEDRDIIDESDAVSSRYSYDAGGNIIAVTDKESKTSIYEYDALNRKVSSTDASGHSTRYFYDSRDNLVALQDPNSNTTRFEYDRNNRLVKEVRPMGQQTLYVYDAAGHIIRKTDAKGQGMEYGYDDAGRLIEVRHFSATEQGIPVRTVTLSYDRVGHLKSYGDGETYGEYEYDDTYRKVSERVHYGSFELSQASSWYRNGLKRNFRGPNGIVYEYNYDGNNQLKGIAVPGKGFITINAYQWNRPAAVSVPGGTTKRFDYDSLMRVNSVAARDPGQNTVLSHQYSYDRMDNVIARATEHGDYQYAYDELYRLRSTTYPHLQKETFDYDPVGNRLAADSATGPSAYSGNNELVGYNGIAYTYDANGNTIQAAEASRVSNFLYDVENRLIRVDNGVDSPTVEYGYDPFGRRLWKEIDGTRTYFFYSEEGLVGEYDASGEEIRSYGYRPGSNWTTDPVFMKRGSVYYYFHNDHLGTPVLITDESGAVVWSAKYSSFGQASIDAGSTLINNLRLPGQYFDAETGLHYNFHRYYDPKTGRYSTSDPIGFAGGINTYVFVQNNPLNRYDPFGLKPGDIYLFTETPGFAKLIGFLSLGGSYGHAGIELSNGRMLTADKNGVQIVDLCDAVNNTKYDLYRPKTPPSTQALDDFARQAKLNNSERYNWSGLVGLQIIFPWEISAFYIQKEYTCAEVVWWASLYSGNYLGMMGTQITPNEIAHSPSLLNISKGNRLR